MLSIANKYLRAAMLALVLLPAASVNCLCVSYDMDDDDNIPPVNVELSVITPSRSVSPAGETKSSPRSHRCAYPLRAKSPLVASHDQRQAPAALSGSPQFAIPLLR